MPQVLSCLSDEFHEQYKARLQKVARQLQSGATKSAGLDQKKHRLWTVRLNQKLRLFLTRKGSDIILLHIMENHKYKLELPIAEKLKEVVLGTESGLSRCSSYILEEVDQKSDGDDDAIEMNPAYLFRDCIFKASPEQTDVIYSQGSLIAYGPAGAGKSSCALFLIEQLLALPSEDPQKPILFLTDSSRLVMQMKKDSESLGLNNTRVIFMTTEAFYRQRLGENTHFVNEEAFKDYYINKKNNKTASDWSVLWNACKFPVDIKEPDKKAFLGQVLYQELCLLAPWGSYEEESGVVHIGKNSSYFNIKDFPEVKASIVRVLEAYRAQLTQKTQVDLAISVFPEISEKQYFYLLGDEGQNKALNEHAYETKIAEEFCIFMDDKQKIKGPKSDILLKRRLLEEMTRKSIPIHRLSKSYRNSVAVESVANEVLNMRDDVAGISPEISNTDQEKAMGEAKLYVFETDVEERTVYEEILNKIARYKKTEVVIISAVDRAEVQKLFPGYIVCHPSEAQGLEFQCAVLLHPWGTSRKNNPCVDLNQSLKSFAEKAATQTAKSAVPHSLKHAITVENPRHMQLLQTLYMNCTRPSQGLLVVQKKFEGNEIVLERWAKSFPVEHEVIEKAEETTEEDWKARLTEMMSSEERNEKQIKELVEQHLYKDRAFSQASGRWLEFLKELNLAENSSVTQLKEKVINSSASTQVAMFKKKENKKTNNKMIQPAIEKASSLPVPVIINDVLSLNAALDQWASKRNDSEIVRKNILDALSSDLGVSLFYDLSLPKNQAIFLRVMKANVFQSPNDISLTVLINRWEIGKEKDASALWQLLQTDIGCEILHQLILFHSLVGGIFFKKAVFFLADNDVENKENFESIICRALHKDRCKVLLSLLEFSDVNNRDELAFVKYFIVILQKNINHLVIEDVVSFYDMPYEILLEYILNKQKKIHGLYCQDQSKQHVGMLGMISNIIGLNSQDPGKKLAAEISKEIYSLTCLIVREISKQIETVDFSLRCYARAMEIFSIVEIDNVNELRRIYEFLKEAHSRFLTNLYIPGKNSRHENLGEVYCLFIYTCAQVSRNNLSSCSELAMQSYCFLEENSCLNRLTCAEEWRVSAYNNVWQTLSNELYHLQESSLSKIKVFFDRLFNFFNAHKQNKCIGENVVPLLKGNAFCLFSKLIKAHFEHKDVILENELSEILDIILQFFMFLKNASISITDNDKPHVLAQVFKGLDIVVERFFLSLEPANNAIKTKISKKLTGLQTLCVSLEAKGTGRTENHILGSFCTHFPSPPEILDSTSTSAIKSEGKGIFGWW